MSDSSSLLSMVPEDRALAVDSGEDQLQASIQTPLLSNNRLRAESFARGNTDVFFGKKKLGVIAVAFLAFFNVSGGPIGTEEIVSSVGPLPGFVGMILFAFGWGLPLSLITSELSTAFPDDGGYSIWVAEAYGEFWGFQESFWSWFSGVVDSAVYPVLAYETIVKLYFDTTDDTPDDSLVSPGIEPFALKLGILVVFSIPNFIYLSTFGKGLSVLLAFVLIPFTVMIVVSLSINTLHWENLLEYKKGERFSGGWFNLLSVLYWNFSGFDCCSTFAGEVECPKKTYPRGTLLALLMTCLTYFLVLGSAAVVNKPHWESWEEGSLPSIAEKQVGHWMAIWILIGAIASNFGMFAAEVFEDAWQLYGMAEAGLAPACFKYRHKRFDTPWNALILGNIIVAVLMTFDFDFIIGVSNFFSVISAILELCAFFTLRVKRPNLPRPYKIPVSSTLGLLLVLAFPMLIGASVAVSTLFESVASFLLSTFALVFGVAMYKSMRQRGHVQYSYTRYGSAN